jgi:hypothetical protein
VGGRDGEFIAGDEESLNAGGIMKSSLIVSNPIA